MKKIHILILFIIFIIGFGLFFGNYEWTFLYYEESKSDKIADYIIAPLFIILLFLIIIKTRYRFLKSKRSSNFERAKNIFFVLFFIAILYSISRNIMSGIILFANSHLGNQVSLTIEGEVIKTVAYSGKSSHYELTILSKKKQYVFETTSTETDKYNTGNFFKRSLTLGCLGLIYTKE